MSTKLLSTNALLIVFLSFFCIALQAHSAEFDYTTGIDGKLTITGYSGSGGAVVVPSSLDGKTVARIAETVFTNKSSITNVSIAESVSMIGKQAFWACTNLEKVTLPQSLVSVSESLFAGCSSLTSITIPESVTNIGSGAFNACTKLDALLIPDGVLRIGDHALDGCRGLTNLVIGRKVQAIGFAAFYYCDKLPSFTVDPLNDSFSSVGGVLLNKSMTEVIRCPEAKRGTWNMPNTVTNIQRSAFVNCAGLNAVVFGTNVMRIEDEAFFGCSSITEVRLPDSMQRVGSMAFAACDSLRRVFVPATVRRLEDLTFLACVSLQGAYFSGDAPETGEEVLDASPVTMKVYHMQGTSGWQSQFGDRETAVWYPSLEVSPDLLSTPPSFAIRWGSGQTVVVESTTNVLDGTWLPVSTNTLVNHNSRFTDSAWTNYSTRFYRGRAR